MLDVQINGIRYVEAKHYELLQRHHEEAITRICNLEKEMERTIKLLAKAKLEPFKHPSELEKKWIAEAQRFREAIEVHKRVLKSMSHVAVQHYDQKLWSVLDG